MLKMSDQKPIAVSCKTCGREFKNDDDVFRCFDAEHQIPALADLPKDKPSDENTQIICYTILMLHWSMEGKIIRRVGKTKVFASLIYKGE
jgi:hypothetical protein